ncbi:MAG: tetratricopeptide repeat protein [Deltaproteobacteria bacterium]|nr:tetratricopeptide repeat protein [Deltaproteobacteria bacterium]
MTQDKREIKRSKSSCSDFLVFRTDRDPTACECGPDAEKTVKILSDRFPRLLCEKDLLESAMSCLAEETCFSAMVIRIDDFVEVLAPEKAILNTAAAIEKLCSKTGGIWGVIGDAVFGAFFPGADSARAEKMAAALQKHLCAPDYATVSVGMAGFPTLSYDRQNILENARKALDHAEFFGPDSRVAFDSVSLNISGDKYYQTGEVEKAMDEFRLALLLDETNANARNSLGVCYGVRGEHDRALAEFLETIRIDENELMGLYNAGYIHMLKKEYDKALTYFSRAAKIDENIFELAFQMGRIFLETGHPEDALKQFKTAVSLKPDSTSANRFYGDALTAADRPKEAINAYKTALRLQPHDAEALSALGFLYEMEEKNADIALMFCKNAVELDPENGLFHHRLGRVYYNRKKFEDALAEFEKASDLGYDADEYIARSRKEVVNGNTRSASS